MTPRFATMIPAIPVGALLLIGFLTFIARNPPPGGLGDSPPRAQAQASPNPRAQNDPASQNNPPPRQAATGAAAMVVGTWTCSGPVPGGTRLLKGKHRTVPDGKYAGRVTYGADGSFEAAFTASSPGIFMGGKMSGLASVSYQLWGRWKLDGAELTRTITRSHPPGKLRPVFETGVVRIARRDLLLIRDESCHPAVK